MIRRRFIQAAAALLIGITRPMAWEAEAVELVAGEQLYRSASYQTEKGLQFIVFVRERTQSEVIEILSDVEMTGDIIGLHFTRDSDPVYHFDKKDTP